MVIRSTQSYLPAGSSSWGGMRSHRAIHVDIELGQLLVPAARRPAGGSPENFASASKRGRSVVSHDDLDILERVSLRHHDQPVDAGCFELVNDRRVQLQVGGRGDLERFEITALVGGEGADGLDDLADPGRVEIESDPP